MLSFEWGTRPKTGPEVQATEIPFMILLNGFPCEDKCDVAYSLEGYFAGSRLISCNLLNEAVDTTVSMRGPIHHAMCKEVRRLAFDNLKQDSTHHSSALIMTSWLDDTPEGCDIFAEYVEIARVRKTPMIVVSVFIDGERNAEFLDFKNRITEATKEINRFLTEEEFFAIGKQYFLLSREKMREVAGDLNQFFDPRLNVTGMSVQEVFDKIVDFLHEPMKML